MPPDPTSTEGASGDEEDFPEALERFHRAFAGRRAPRLRQEQGRAPVGKIAPAPSSRRFVVHRWVPGPEEYRMHRPTDRAAQILRPTACGEMVDWTQVTKVAGMVSGPACLDRAGRNVTA